jgi:exocyst complex component 3
LSSHVPWPAQYPELDRLEQFRARTARKKAAIETRLKTAVNSQLDDVKHGIQLLQM